MQMHLYIDVTKMEIKKGIVLPQTRQVDVGGGGPETYVVSFLWLLKSVAFPVDGCSEKTNNLGRLRKHLMCWHWKAKVVITQEIVEPLFLM